MNAINHQKIVFVIRTYNSSTTRSISIWWMQLMLIISRTILNECKQMQTNTKTCARTKNFLDKARHETGGCTLRQQLVGSIWHSAFSAPVSEHGCIHRRLVGAQPGNSFVSFVRAYARFGCLVELDLKRGGLAFPFSLLAPPSFPFSLLFSFSLPLTPKPPIQL